MKHLYKETKDISILIVTRPNWSTGLKTSLQSLLENTNNLNNIEILIKVDHNASEETYNVVKQYSNLLPIKPFIMDGHWGRNGVPEYTNLLAWNSCGELLWWWSDEISVGTKNWDIFLPKYVERWKDIPVGFFDKNRCGFYPGCN